MTEPRPIDVTRKDGALVPKQRWLFDRLFEEGGDYTIEIHEPRSDKSHRHYFAAIREAWKNLPEDIAAQHPSPEHLRKWALIKLGWSIKRNVVCESAAQRDAVAAMAGQLDENAVIVVQGMVVTVATAKTQKTTGPGAMSRDDFQQSKQQVLEYCASLIGVDVATLSAQVPDSSGKPHLDQMDAPGDSGPHPAKSPGARNSNSSGNHVANDLTDTPAADPDKITAAGVNHYVEEASLLPPDWRDTYVIALTNPTTRAMSIQTRDTNALQMMGCNQDDLVKPNAAEREWMRQVATLTNKRDKGKLTADDFAAALERLKVISLAEIMGLEDAA